MADCKYCTNYFQNLDNRVDSSCMGKGDCRKSYFSCNENLKTGAIYNKDFNSKTTTEEMIRELQKLGYEVTKTEGNTKLYIVYNEDYCWKIVVRAKNYKEAMNKFHKWMDKNNSNNDIVWNSRNEEWYTELCDNNKVIT